MNIHYSSDAAIERIGRGLIDASLPRAEWTHTAHFAAVLWLLRHRPEPDPSIAMPDLIRRYNDIMGDGNSDTGGYHETITQTSIAAARNFLNGREGRPLHEVLNELMASHLGRPDWLLAHWSRERLFSVDARRSWVEPDLLPLSFLM